MIVGNFWFWTGEVFKLITAPTAILWNSLLIVILWKSSALHINVHILLINISCCATLSSLVLLAKSLFTLIVVITDKVCWIRVPYQSLCQFQTGMFFVAQLPIFGSTVMLGFERLYATLRIDTYEINSGSLLAKLCVTLLWLISLILSVVLIMTVPGDVQLPYCNGLFMLHRTTIATLSAVLPLLVFLGTLLYVSIWLFNRRQLKRKKQITVYRFSFQNTISAKRKLILI